MNLIYKYSESSKKPSEVDVQKTSVYLRKDIVEEIRQDPVEHVVWIYQEASMSLDEFNKYASLVSAVNALKGVNDSSNILRIIDGQAAGDDNQLIIMEAIADLYDAIAMLQMGGTEE